MPKRLAIQLLILSLVLLGTGLLEGAMTAALLAVGFDAEGAPAVAAFLSTAAVVVGFMVFAAGLAGLVWAIRREQAWIPVHAVLNKIAGEYGHAAAFSVVQGMRFPTHSEGRN